MKSNALRDSAKKKQSEVENLEQKLEELLWYILPRELM